MTDLIYITGGRSAWQDNELRYSLRSMQKYLTNMGNVFVVGTSPDFLHTNRIIIDYEMNEVSYTGNRGIGIGGRIKSSTQLFHIPATDHPTEKKEVRLYRKIMKACRDERITENALLCYDDNFLLQPNDADTFPNYYEGDLELYYNRVQRKGTHKRCIANTISILGGSAKMFDVHCPIRINRNLFIRDTSCLGWQQRDGYLIKSTYANLSGVVGTECRDTKINHPDGTLAEYRQMITDKPWFSVGDNMNWPSLQELMNELYPEPSQWGK